MNELTEELKSKFQSYDQEQLNDAFIEACEKGYLEIVIYLLTSPELNKHADIHMGHDYGFRLACGDGHLDVIKYLLTSPELKEHADINAIGFIWACENGHLDVVRYLLTSPELKDHADIHARNDYGFISACKNGHLELVRYLLISPELSENADIHADNDLGFRWGCAEGHLEIVCYLLTFSGEQYVNFQKTEYNLDWSISKKHHDIVKTMITSLYKNDMMAYLENIPKVEEYCQNHGLNFQKWQEEMINDDVGVNSHTTELFL